MRISTTLAVLLGAASVIAHPEKLTKESAKRELVGRNSNKCARHIAERRDAMVERRRQRLYERQVEAGRIIERRDVPAIERRANKYATIQNDTCVLAPDTIWGPYGIDGELFRHDVREGQSGIDLYLDIGVMDVETCEPLPNAYLSIWHCNATGNYGGFTGIDPNTASLADGWTTRSDGTTDDTTFLRGVMNTDSEGIAEFLTIFPGYYITRTTHIHLTVQTNVTDINHRSFNESAIQHIGQLFFEEDLINQVYQLDPYSAHLSTLNRTTNAEDSLFSSTANTDGYSAIISTELLGDTLADGLVGYITVGVNSSAAGLATTGTNVNVLGELPTVSVAASAQSSALAVDKADGYKKA